MVFIYMYAGILGLLMGLYSPEPFNEHHELLSKKNELDRTAIESVAAPTKRIIKKYEFKNYPQYEIEESDSNLIIKVFEGKLPLKKDDVRNLYFTVAAELLEPLDVGMENLKLVLYHSPWVKNDERDRVIILRNRPKRKNLWYEKISKTGFSEVVSTETLDEALKKLNPQVREKFIKAGGLK